MKLGYKFERLDCERIQNLHFDAFKVPFHANFDKQLLSYSFKFRGINFLH